jgi:hypothetical protein
MRDDIGRNRRQQQADPQGRRAGAQAPQ